MEPVQVKTALDALRPHRANTMRSWPKQRLGVRHTAEGATAMESWPFRLPAKNRAIEEVDPQVRATIRSMIEGLEPWPLAIIGDAGSGKTCAALCVCDRAGGSAFTSASDLCRMVRDGAEGRLTSAAGYVYHDSDVWNGWRQANIAVLDELGIREKASDFQYETVKKALDERIENELPLIVISNMGIPELARCYDDRIASRIGSGTVLVMMGDRRIP